MTELTLPAAILFLIGGILACFAGYRLFRVVLGVYGFIAGALVASSVYGAGGVLTLLAVLVGGLIGAVIMLAAYYFGVALMGAIAGVLVADLIWAGLGSAPHWIVLLLFGLLGAAGALAVQRIAIIIGTSLLGAWTAILGALALSTIGVETEAGAGGVRLIYPPGSAPAGGWFLVAWIILTAVGIGVQVAGTGRTEA